MSRAVFTGPRSLWVLLALATIPFACATPETTGLAAEGSGGQLPTSTGGNTTGGVVSSGGTVASTGGTLATGGTVGSGGTVSTGGVSATGGSVTTGGVSSSSGGSATGGLSTATGGTTSNGGSAGAATGGAATGGVSAAGGTTSKGGSGGTAMGGASTGGAATGGASTGGASTGGAATGGTATGGTSTGGASTGGTATGGTSTGGITGCGVCVVHRYSFAGSGTTVTDSVGTAHGTAMNTTVASGAVALAGTTSDQYVSLPQGVLSGLTNATFEAWVTWSAGGAWQRIFDFGDNDGAGAGSQGTNGVTYLFLSPKAVNNSGHLRVAYTVSGPSGETMIDAATALPSGAVAHVAVVVDQTAATLALYLNGAVSGTSAFSGSLASINNVNNWLGRSQFAADPEFAGSMQEFRVYSVARSAAQIQASFTAGPDALPAN